MYTGVEVGETWKLQFAEQRGNANRPALRSAVGPATTEMGRVMVETADEMGLCEHEV